MNDSTLLIARLRRIAATGLPVADGQSDGQPVDRWLTAGLSRGHLHELYAGNGAGNGAENGTCDDAASAAGFGIALALAAGATPVLWLRTEGAERQGGRLHAGGLHELGLDPHALVLAVVADEATLLRAAADAARCAGLGTLLVESWGRAPGLDLTATRRLQLAAESSGVTVMLLRVAATPVPSAAATRWSVAACPSTALDADAPGGPAFHIELQRRRGGPAGQSWRVEWNRDTHIFDAPIFEAPIFDTPPLSGADLSLVADRTAARDTSAPVRRQGWG